MVSSGAIATVKLITLCLELVFVILVSFGILIGEKRYPQFNKVWFVILPLAAMLLPTFINVIDMLF